MPLNRSRAGFTLVELLIVMVLMGMVGAIVVRVLTDTQRLTVAQSEQAMVQSTTRTGVLVLPSELREINPALGDIKVMDDTSITYRGMRTLGISCVQPTKASVRVLTSSIAGLKVDFLANDSLLLFVEGDPTTATDDGWALARVAAVSSATACPTGPGTTLTLQPNVRMADNPAVEPDDSWFPAVAIVRGFENTVIASYEDANGDTWLGMESPAGAAIQPVLGPLDRKSVV